MCIVYVKCTIYSLLDTSIHLSVVLGGALKASWWLRAFPCRRKNPICLILQAKIWAVQQNLISCVSYSSAPWYSHGNAYLLRESQSDQRRLFLIWTWKMEEGGVKRGEEGERGGERQGPSGNDNTWSSLGGLLNLAHHHHFMRRYYPQFQDITSSQLFSLSLSPDWLRRFDSYIVCVCATARVKACQGILLLLW